MATLIKPAEVVNSGIFRAAPTNARFDINLLAPHIKVSEERFLVPIIGRTMYDDLVSKQNAAVSNYNPDAGALVAKFPTDAAYETLWTTYLLNYVGNFVYYQSLPFIGVQVGSKGVFYNDSEFATNGGLQAVKFLQDTILQSVNSVRELLIKYLCENKATYTLFDSKDCKCDICENDCKCGFFDMYGTICPTCTKGKNISSNIIFY